MIENSSELTLNIPAKLNLFFEVIRRLTTGFHEIESLVTPISIHDTLRVKPSAGLNFSVKISPEEKYQRLFAGKTIPTDDSNLVLRAVYRLKESLLPRRDLPGADIILTKRIPSEAGMGGGSSDAAAALLLLNEFWKVGLSRDALAEIGAEIGSDVPLFLKGFPVICRGRGEIIESVPNGESLPTLHFVVVKPPTGCSTPAVYRLCEPQGPQNSGVIQKMVNAWRENDLETFAEGLKNRLMAPALQVAPDVRKVLEALSSVPVPLVGFSMTGSGSACFGLCRTHEEALKNAEFLEKNCAGTVFTAESELAPLQILRTG